MPGAVKAAVVAMVVALPAPLFAQNRPDLVDFNHQRFYTLPYGTHSMYLSAQQAYAWAYGKHEITKAVQSWAELTFTIYEPDKVKRKGDQATVQQSAYAIIWVRLRSPALPTFVASAAPLGCKAKAQAKAAIGKWSVTCSADGLDALGLSPAQKAAFERVVGSTTFKFSGTNF